MLSHVLANNPRIGYAHQSDLIGPAAQTVDGTTSDFGYTLITPDQQHAAASTTAGTARRCSRSPTRANRRRWPSSPPGPSTETAGTVTATEQNGNVTITSSGSATVPVTVPSGSTVNGTAFGQSYGGTLSQWLPLNNGSTTITESVAPSIISGAAANSIVGAPFSFTVVHHRRADPGPDRDRRTARRHHLHRQR